MARVSFRRAIEYVSQEEEMNDWVLASRLLGVEVDIYIHSPEEIAEMITVKTLEVGPDHLEDIIRRVEDLGSHAVRDLLVYDDEIELDNLLPSAIQAYIGSTEGFYDTAAAIVLEKGTLEDYETIYTAVDDDSIREQLKRMVLQNAISWHPLFGDRDEIIRYMVEQGRVMREDIVTVDPAMREAYFDDSLPYTLEGVMKVVKGRLGDPVGDYVLWYLLPLIPKGSRLSLCGVGYMLDVRATAEVKSDFVRNLFDEYKVSSDGLGTIVLYYLHLRGMKPEVVRQITELSQDTDSAPSWVDRAIRFLLRLPAYDQTYECLKIILNAYVSKLNLEDYRGLLSNVECRYREVKEAEQRGDFLTVHRHKHLFFLHGMEPTSPSREPDFDIRFAHYTLDLSLAYEISKVRGMEFLEGQSPKAARAVQATLRDLEEKLPGPLAGITTQYALERKEMVPLSYRVGTGVTSYTSIDRRVRFGYRGFRLRTYVTHRGESVQEDFLERDELTWKDCEVCGVQPRA